MSTKRTAKATVRNALPGTAVITLVHQYSDQEPQTGSWLLKPNEVSGPMELAYETGAGTGFDYWFCSALITDGPSPGLYTTEGTKYDPTKECMLTSDVDGKTVETTIHPDKFYIDMPSDTSAWKNCTTSVTFKPRITNVFVLMLENRSFDHLFGFSGLTGIDAETGEQTSINGLTGNETNSYTHPTRTGAVEMTTSPVIPGVVDPMPTDPGHEFLDTLEQLCGQGVVTYPDPVTGKYPAINNSGFAANYATSADENTGLPSQASISDILHCCTPEQIPVLYKLAQEFAICDNWFSSMPGPTWPNRLFALGASSAGLDDTPTKGQISSWQFDGVDYPNGSILDRMDDAGIKYRVYNDSLDWFASDPSYTTEGTLTIISALSGVTAADVLDVLRMQEDVKKNYPYRFTFIEPNYGNVSNDSYSGGSSQHAMDSLVGGEALIAYVYGAIRNSPIWESSLLIITYDEHGGFYDHVAPRAAKAPDDGDGPGSSHNTHGFDFKQYGVRVPAVIVSPLIPKGTIDHTKYDHTSIIKTLTDFYSMEHLTKRDKDANSVARLLALLDPRSDCPTSVSVPYTDPPPHKIIDPSARDAEPLPEKGNLLGFLYIAAKTDVELSGGGEATKTAVRAKLESILTRGQAREYLQEVAARLKAAQAAKAAAPAESE